MHVLWSGESVGVKCDKVEIWDILCQKLIVDLLTIVVSLMAQKEIASILMKLNSVVIAGAFYRKSRD
jgi:hypothetical protein